MFDLKVKGANQLGDLAKRLKAEGETGKRLRLEMLRELRGAAKPLAEQTKDAVRSLPTKPPEDTGLRRRVAAGVKVRTRTTGARTGVRITAGRLDGTNLPRRLNAGKWRHPVYGNRNVYVTQTIKPGWFDETLKRGAPKVRVKVLKVMRDTSNRITRG